MTAQTDPLFALDKIHLPNRDKFAGKRIAVRKQEAFDMSPGGIVLPDLAQEELGLGIVAILGDGLQDQTEIALDDIILAGKYTFEQRPLGERIAGVKLYVLAWQDIDLVFQVGERHGPNETENGTPAPRRADPAPHD